MLSRAEAYELLEGLGAPDRLIRHARLVSEAADALINALRELHVSLNALIVELGAVLHDAGKIVHPEELAQAGSLHEQAGEALLLAHQVQPKIASCCRSHGAWGLANVSLEETIVALSDKLWKSKREAELELLVINKVAARLKASRWDVFEWLDSTFEEIASNGAAKLERSRREISNR